MISTAWTLFQQWLAVASDIVRIVGVGAVVCWVWWHEFKKKD